VMTDPNEPQVYDWQADGGILEGRIDPTVSANAPSLLAYQRPLADGERVAYQFLYEPGKTHVHPALGRIAFLLEADGVKLHWLNGLIDLNEPLLVDRRTRIDDPSCRRGPAALPLKENDWNDVELTTSGGQLAIRVNGELVFERPIDAA